MFSFWYFEEAFMLILENFVINKKRKNSVIFKKRKKICQIDTSFVLCG